MNRICPSERTLSEYLCNCLSPEERINTEKHLACCKKCRKTIVEAFDILEKPDIKEISFTTISWIRTNKWILASSTLLLISFIFTEYFLQFLIASCITAIKWIIDSKTTKMLITVHNALKNNEENSKNKEEKWAKNQ